MAHADASSLLARLLVQPPHASRRHMLAALIVSGLAIAQAGLADPNSSLAKRKKKGKKKKQKGGKGTKGGSALPPPTAADLDAFLPLINAHRANNGKPALVRNGKLDIAAQVHSDNMVERNFFAHLDPLTGKDQEDRIADAGYAADFNGENIFKGFDGAQRAFNAWRDSTDHNANMLSGDFQEIGIGCANANGGLWHWTTVFASPD